MSQLITRSNTKRVNGASTAAASQRTSLFESKAPGKSAIHTLPRVVRRSEVEQRVIATFDENCDRRASFLLSLAALKERRQCDSEVS